MTEELLVVVMLESSSKCKCVEVTRVTLEACTVSLISVLIIIDIRCYSVPADIFLLLDMVTKTKHFHSIVIKGFWFGKIEHVELDALAFSCVSDSEEIPLGVAICVDVIL